MPGHAAESARRRARARRARSEPAVVGVPGQAFRYADRRHIFYRVQRGDTRRAIASVLPASALDELRMWNAISHRRNAAAAA